MLAPSKISDISLEEVGSDLAYDNKAGANDQPSQGNTQVIGGGSIVIRTK